MGLRTRSEVGAQTKMDDRVKQSVACILPVNVFRQEVGTSHGVARETGGFHEFETKVLFLIMVC